MRLRTVLRVAACCLASEIGVASAGLVLAPARFDEVTDDVYRGSPAEPESIETVIDVGLGHVVETATTTGGALPTAEVTITANAGESASASARVEFQFGIEQIVAGSPVLVPVVVTGAGDADVSVDGTDGAVASAQLTLSGGGGEIRTTACAPPENFPGGDCAGNPFEATLDAAGFPGAVFTVRLDASASGGPAPSSVGSLAASAFVDPVVAIDPSFARRDEFRLLFSEGVNPVPEPNACAGAFAALTALVPLVRSSRARQKRARCRTRCRSAASAPTTHTSSSTTRSASTNASTTRASPTGSSSIQTPAMRS